jgi:hypothetical protein
MIKNKLCQSKVKTSQSKSYLQCENSEPLGHVLSLHSHLKLNIHTHKNWL